MSAKSRDKEVEMKSKRKSIEILNFYQNIIYISIRMQKQFRYRVVCVSELYFWLNIIRKSLLSLLYPYYSMIEYKSILNGIRKGAITIYGQILISSLLNGHSKMSLSVWRNVAIFFYGLEIFINGVYWNGGGGTGRRQNVHETPSSTSKRLKGGGGQSQTSANETGLYRRIKKRARPSYHCMHVPGIVSGYYSPQRSNTVSPTNMHKTVYF